MTTTPTDEPLVSETCTGPRLLGLAAAAGIEPQPGSALATVAAGFAAEAADAPSDAWAQMLLTLSRSSRRADGAVSGADGALVMAFHGDDESWVGLWPESEGFRVTGPLTDRGLGGYLGVFFGTLRTPAATVPVTVSEQGAIALAAAVDAWRSARLVEWVRHEPGGGSSFPADGADQALYAGKKTVDGRWLVALLGDVCAAVREVADTRAGLGELAEAGLVTRSQDGVVELAGDLVLLADDTWFPQPALTMTAGAESPQRRLVAVRGRDTVWTMSATGDQWRIEGRDGLGLADHIAELLAHPD